MNFIFGLSEAAPHILLLDWYFYTASNIGDFFPAGTLQEYFKDLARLTVMVGGFI